MMQHHWVIGFQFWDRNVVFKCVELIISEQKPQQHSVKNLKLTKV